jgi:hypothetical protein
VLWRRSLDAVVLLPADGDEVLSLAGTGPAVWELLADWRTFDDLVTLLAEAFKAAPEVVEADLTGLMTELEAHGVLETAAESGGSDRG